MRQTQLHFVCEYQWSLASLIRSFREPSSSYNAMFVTVMYVTRMSERKWNLEFSNSNFTFFKTKEIFHKVSFALYTAGTADEGKLKADLSCLNLSSIPNDMKKAIRSLLTTTHRQKEMEA